ncbi:MAG: DUF4384 domain-containing protein [Deltaproteobacteria bacterium]|nr:MAG: DUF4384 domain-containing protein [Deltaproteobacteria bacterium]
MKFKLSILQVHHLRTLFLLILFFATVRIAQAQNTRAIEIVLDQERRSCIQAVDGYAYLSENMTLAQSRAAAFANARRQALEAAKTYIQSKTKVKNFQLEYDLIMSDAEGSVTVLEQKDYGVEGNNRYHVWIKAEVVYNLSPHKAVASQATIMNKEAPLTVKVWTDKKQYNHGEKITIFVQGNRDYYARIVDITSNGEIIQLLPNDYRPRNFFRGGIVYKIPSQEDRFELEVTPPYGEDNVLLYASEAPLGEVTMDSIGQGLRQYRGARSELAFQTRGIKIVGTTTHSSTGAEFYEATWTLTTRR